MLSSKIAILLVVFLIDTISAIAVTTFPRATANVTYSQPRVLARNEIFDGEMKRFNRGSEFLDNLLNFL